MASTSTTSTTGSPADDEYVASSCLFNLGLGQPAIPLHVQERRDRLAMKQSPHSHFNRQRRSIRRSSIIFTQLERTPGHQKDTGADRSMIVVAPYSAYPNSSCGVSDECASNLSSLPSPQNETTHETRQSHVSKHVFIPKLASGEEPAPVDSPYGSPSTSDLLRVAGRVSAEEHQHVHCIPGPAAEADVWYLSQTGMGPQSQSCGDTVCTDLVEATCEGLVSQNIQQLDYYQKLVLPSVQLHPHLYIHA